jgi:hypothetical protein
VQFKGKFFVHRGGSKMAGVIDVRDLTEEEIKLLQDLVECLRAKAKKRTGDEKQEVEEVVLAAHPSDVIGGLTRKEIYEHL